MSFVEHGKTLYRQDLYGKDGKIMKREFFSDNDETAEDDANSLLNENLEFYTHSQLYKIGVEIIRR